MILPCIQGSDELIAFAALQSAQAENRITIRARAPQVRDLSNTPASMSPAMDKSTLRCTTVVNAEDDKQSECVACAQVAQAHTKRLDIERGDTISEVRLMVESDTLSAEFEFSDLQSPESSLEEELNLAGDAGPAVTHLISGLDHCWRMKDVGSTSSYIGESQDQLTRVPSLLRIDILFYSNCVVSPGVQR